MRFKVEDIIYDTDGKDFGLPAEMIIDLEDHADPWVELADAVSDKTGFCITGLSFEEYP